MINRSFKTFLTEGGNAFKDSGTTPIKMSECSVIAEEVMETINSLDPKFKTKLLGSAQERVKSKKDHANDLDICVLHEDHDSRSLPELMIDAIKALGYEHKFFKVFNILSVRWPINETHIQIDLILSGNEDYTDWSYYYPSSDESSYGSTERNEMLFGICKCKPISIIDKDDSGNPLTLERYIYDLSKGLFTAKQSRVSPKTGKIVKNEQIIEKNFVTDDPTEVVRLLLGDKHKIDETLTFESLYEIIVAEMDEESESIFEYVRHKLKTKNKDIPSEL